MSQSTRRQPPVRLHSKPRTWCRRAKSANSRKARNLLSSRRTGVRFNFPGNSQIVPGRSAHAKQQCGLVRDARAGLLQPGRFLAKLNCLDLLQGSRGGSPSSCQPQIGLIDGAARKAAASRAGGILAPHRSAHVRIARRQETVAVMLTHPRGGSANRRVSHGANPRRSPHRGCRRRQSPISHRCLCLRCFLGGPLDTNTLRIVPDARCVPGRALNRRMTPCLCLLGE